MNKELWDEMEFEALFFTEHDRLWARAGWEQVLIAQSPAPSQALKGRPESQDDLAEAVNEWSETEAGHLFYVTLLLVNRFYEAGHWAFDIQILAEQTLDDLSTMAPALGLIVREPYYDFHKTTRQDRVATLRKGLKAWKFPSQNRWVSILRDLMKGDSTEVGAGMGFMAEVTDAVGVQLEQDFIKILASETLGELNRKPHSPELASVMLRAGRYVYLREAYIQERKLSAMLTYHQIQQPLAVNQETQTDRLDGLAVLTKVDRALKPLTLSDSLERETSPPPIPQNVDFLSKLVRVLKDPVFVRQFKTWWEQERTGLLLVSTTESEKLAFLFKLMCVQSLEFADNTAGLAMKGVLYLTPYGRTAAHLAHVLKGVFRELREVDEELARIFARLEINSPCTVKEFLARDPRYPFNSLNARSDESQAKVYSIVFIEDYGAIDLRDLTEVLIRIPKEAKVVLATEPIKWGTRGRLSVLEQLTARLQLTTGLGKQPPSIVVLGSENFNSSELLKTFSGYEANFIKLVVDLGWTTSSLSHNLAPNLASNSAPSEIPTVTVSHQSPKTTTTTKTTISSSQAHHTLSDWSRSLRRLIAEFQLNSQARALLAAPANQAAKGGLAYYKNQCLKWYSSLREVTKQGQTNLVLVNYQDVATLHKAIQTIFMPHWEEHFKLSAALLPLGKDPYEPLAKQALDSTQLSQLFQTTMVLSTATRTEWGVSALNAFLEAAIMKTLIPASQIQRERTGFFLYPWKPVKNNEPIHGDVLFNGERGLLVHAPSSRPLGSPQLAAKSYKVFWERERLLPSWNLEGDLNEAVAYHKRHRYYPLQQQAPVLWGRTLRSAYVGAFSESYHEEFGWDTLGAVFCNYTYLSAEARGVEPAVPVTPYTLLMTLARARGKVYWFMNKADFMDVMMGLWGGKDR